MNWYFEHEGVAQGPHNEGQMALLAARGDVTPQCLVWHAGMEEWRRLCEVEPSWLGAPPAAEEPPPAPVMRKKSKPPTSADEADDERPPPPLPRALPKSKPSAMKEPPMETMLKPKAPTPSQSAESEGPKKSGILKRLFGGKK